MTKAKVDDKSMNAEQAFDVELFEKENFEYVRDCRLAAEKAFIEKQENDPAQMAVVFEFEDSCCFKSLEEEDAHDEQASINLAKQKIRDLKEEITKQEAIILVSNSRIKRYKRQMQIEKVNKRGRPVRSEYREQIARKFTMKWVASLMESLEVKSCGAEGGLAKVISSTQERNWRRWLSGEAIPSYSTFENLLDAEITCGKYSGGQLFKVPVTPTHDQILTLLQFI